MLASPDLCQLLGCRDGTSVYPGKQICALVCMLLAMQVWSIRVDIHVLDSGGNLIDACCLAALAALLGFRKPQVEVDQSKGEGEAQVTVFSPDVSAKQCLP